VYLMCLTPVAFLLPSLSCDPAKQTPHPPISSSLWSLCGVSVNKEFTVADVDRVRLTLCCFDHDDMTVSGVRHSHFFT
jgi:hypothetical protein